MGCDLCGAEGRLYRVRIEGTVMTVCDSCKQYGDVIEPLPTEREKHDARIKKDRKESQDRKESRPETLLLVREDYGRVIKTARERLGLKQEELAKKLRIKESKLHKYETGSRTPDLETARLFEKVLKVRLVEEHVEERSTTPHEQQDGPLTIGDLLKQR